MRKKPIKPPAFSEIISDTCKVMEDAIKDYNWNVEQLEQMDALTQDYLHKLELEDLSRDERATLATKLRDCRRLRRAHKDTVSVLEPLVSWLDSDRGKTLYNLLREILGKTRKAEERMKSRVYFPRVLDEAPIEDKKS